jgi:hypothetical protein
MGGKMKIWYMRDNHTFRPLSSEWEIAKTELADEFSKGHTYGMLCSKDFPNNPVHAGSGEKFFEFIVAAENWYKNITEVSIGAYI